MKLAVLERELGRIRSMSDNAENRKWARSAYQRATDLTIGALLLLLALLGAHYIFQIRADLPQVITYLVYVAISGSGGFFISLRNSIAAPTAILLAILIASLALVGMSSVVALYYRQPLFPADSRVGQDSLELLLSLCFGFVSGSLLARVYQNAVYTRSVLGTIARDVVYTIAFSDDEKAKSERILFVQRVVTSVVAAGTTIASIVAALKAANGADIGH